MGKIVKIEKSKIEAALADNVTRQYLTGNLSNPQKLEYIKTKDVEIGISNYPEYTYEEAHTHSVAMEYQLMLTGWTEYMDIDTGEVHSFRAGDFYAIYPNTKYSQRVKGGTRIVFVKVPSVNDKELVTIEKNQEDWLKTKLRTVRTDYYYKDNAPTPNSIKPAAAVAIFNNLGELLLLHRVDNDMWTMPGGTMEFGESLEDCAIREVQEESGLEVCITGIINIFTDPNIVVEYSDGEIRQEFTALYYGEKVGGSIKMDNESKEYRWVGLDKCSELPMTGSQRMRIEEVKKYVNDHSL